MKSADATILVAVLASAAAVAGLAFWGSRKSSAQPGQVVPGGAVVPQNVGPFPSLAVGTPVLVDSARANLPAPFSLSPTVPCVVDMILSDPTLVSVRTGIPGVASFSGTIPRSAIVQILPAVPASLLQV